MLMWVCGHVDLYESGDVPLCAPPEALEDVPMLGCAYVPMCLCGHVDRCVRGDVPLCATPTVELRRCVVVFMWACWPVRTW